MKVRMVQVVPDDTGRDKEILIHQGNYFSLDDVFRGLESAFADGETAKTNDHDPFVIYITQ